jgi:hypothetical protein
MIPFIAIAVGLGVSGLPNPTQFLWSGAVGCVSILAAWTFANDYVRGEQRPIFWAAPHGGEAVWFGRYDELLTHARRMVHPGDRIAYNQAGLIPYMLDVENIDDLGICSRFIARLPTTDVYFTGVGRYSPLTDAPVIRTAHAYLLHQRVSVIIEPEDLITKANADRIPEFVLDRAFRRLQLPLRNNVIYVRTDTVTTPYLNDPRSFTEDLTHVSRIRRAAIDGRVIADREVDRELRFLREQRGDHAFSRSREIAVTFALRDEDVVALYIRMIATRLPGTLTVTLYGETGNEVARRELQTGATAQTALESFPPGTRANLLVLTARAEADQLLTLADVRLIGQTAVLREYVQQYLSFPAR